MTTDTVALSKLLRGGCSLLAIMKRFGIARSQAHAMLKRLEGALGVKVIREGRSRERIYRCDEAGVLTLELPAQEAIPALLLLRDATGSLLAPAMSGAATFGNKIKSALDDEQRARYAALGSRIKLRFLQTRSASTSIYEKFVEAMLLGKTLSLDYSKSLDTPSLKAKSVGGAVGKPWVVEPWAVFYARRHLYAVVSPRDPSSKASGKLGDKVSKLRMVKLCRVRFAALTKDSFVMPASFNLDDYLCQTWEVFRTPAEPLSTVVIDLDPAWAENLVDTVWHPSQEISRNPDGSVMRTADGSVRAKFRLRGFNEIKYWILWLGRGARVVKPKALRDAVLAELAEMSKNHANSKVQI